MTFEKPNPILDTLKRNVHLAGIRMMMNTYIPYWASGARVVRIQPVMLFVD